MPRRGRNLYRETFGGLRRNLSMTLSAVSTGFVALLLLGLAVLGNLEAGKIVQEVGTKFDVVVYLCTPTSIGCQGGVTSSEQSQIQQALKSLPGVTGVAYVSQEQALQDAKVMFKDEPSVINGLTASELPASFGVHLKDPLNFSAVNNKALAMAGVVPFGVSDNADLVHKVFLITAWLRWGVLMVALMALVAAILLIAITVRTAIRIRRREIEVMKLVGATNWYIRGPFMAEAMLQALLAGALAIGIIWAFKFVYLDTVSTHAGVLQLPIVGSGDFLRASLVIVLVGVVASVAAGLLGLRKSLQV